MDFRKRAAAFELGRDNLIEGVTLESRVSQGQQSQTVGFGRGDAPSNTKTVIRDSILIGGSFVIYIWFGNQHRLLVQRSHVAGGRVPVGLLRGSGPDAFEATLEDSTVLADWSRYPGAGGDIAFAISADPNSIGGPICVWIRGGKTMIRRCDLDAVGSPGVDIAAAVGVLAGHWPNSEPGKFPWPAWPAVELRDTHSRVKPNGAEQWADIIANIGTTTTLNGSGTGPDGRPVVKGTAAGQIGFIDVRGWKL